MELFEVIQNRRSIRHYKPDAVSENDLNSILEAARVAPSWANTQCWRFIVVRDASMRNNIADTLLENNRGAEAIRQAPVTIVACAELNKSGIFHGARSPENFDWFMFDVGIAMEHIALAACSLGLGTVHIGAFDPKKAETVLQVPDGYRVVSMTPLGYPENTPAPRSRKPISEIVFYETFGKYKE